MNCKVAAAFRSRARARAMFEHTRNTAGCGCGLFDLLCTYANARSKAPVELLLVRFLRFVAYCALKSLAICLFTIRSHASHDSNANARARNNTLGWERRRWTELCTRWFRFERNENETFASCNYHHAAGALPFKWCKASKRQQSLH